MSQITLVFNVLLLPGVLISQIGRASDTLELTYISQYFSMFHEKSR